jgi:histidinol-phosphate aminotransferase
MKISKNLVRFEGTGAKVYIPTQRYSVDLSLTENPLGFSKKVLEVIEKEKKNISRYPDPFYSELKGALAKKLGISKKNFIFGAGADGLIENVVRVLVNPGDEVVMPELTFLNASFAAVIAGGKPVFSKMRKDFHIDFEDLRKRISKKTKVVFICNPNNPTGLVESKDKILDLVRSLRVFVVVDEANIEFGGDSVIKHVNQLKNLIVIRTFSKGYGLAGMRIGYCVGDEKLIHYIWRLRPPFVNTYLSQKAALAALEDDEHIRKSREYVARERDFLGKELSKRGFLVVPSQANCFLMRVTPLFKSSTKFSGLLHRHDCSVVDGKYFRGLGMDYVRIAPRLHSTNVKFLKIVDSCLNNGRES